MKRAQNFENGVSPNGRAGILRVSPDGDPISKGNSFINIDRSVIFKDYSKCELQ